MDIKTYFSEHQPKAPRITVRCINALVRGGINTMDELCERSDEQLMRVRNLGAKCFEHSVLLREQYKIEIKNSYDKAKQS
jgi:DNA-directed RNA polymerase subunit alpha